MSSEAKGAEGAHAGMFLWALIVGLSFPAVGLLSEGLPPLFLTAIRFAIAAVALGAIVWRAPDRLPGLAGLVLYAAMGLCLAGLSVPCAYASDRGDAKVAPAGEVEAAHREFVAYGEWVLQLDRAVSPAMKEVRAIGPQWQAAMNGGNFAAAEARILPTLTSAKRAIAEARQKLAALPTPDFPTLKLPPEARTSAVHAELVRTLGQLDADLLELWQKTGVRVLPGAYLSKDTAAGNPGKAYIRVAIVAPRDETEEGLTLIRDTLYG